MHVKLVCGLAVVCTAAAMSAAPAAADGPGVGAPWVVSVGDSAISGEAGRWAGNTNDTPSRVDALGGDAYFENAGRNSEQNAGCHRTETAAYNYGGCITSLNHEGSGS